MTAERLAQIFGNIPTLKTERLTLRQMKVCDCFDMFEYAKSRDVTKYLTWSPHPDVEYTKDYLNSLKQHYKMGMFYDWAVVINDENKMIGTCGFTRFSLPNNSAEIGYVINPSYCGRGIAMEAANRVMEFGFFELGLNRIEARYMTENFRSLRVMEKLGMSFEGISRQAILVNGMYRDVGTCSVLKEEFRKHVN